MIVHLDADPAWRETFRQAACEAMPETRVHAAPTAARALALCREVRPTLVATELRLHDGDGFDFIRSLTELPGCPRLFALTDRCDEVALHRAQGDGLLAGLIWKTPAAPAQLRAALPLLCAGGVCFPPEVRDLMRNQRTSPLAYFKILSPTQQELLPLMGKGMTDGEIALHSGRNPETVRWHRSEIMKKLEIRRTPKLVSWTMGKGFVDLGPGAPPCAFAGE